MKQIYLIYQIIPYDEPSELAAFPSQEAAEKFIQKLNEFGKKVEKKLKPLIPTWDDDEDLAWDHNEDVFGKTVWPKNLPICTEYCFSATKDEKGIITRVFYEKNFSFRALPFIRGENL